jgi:outer membrane murein-binding lipoprotein Lpp
MLRPARALLLAAFALALVAVAGCGGGDTKRKNDYVNAVNRAQTEFQTSFDRLQADITATSTPAQERATLARLGRAVDTVVAKLHAINPPAEVAALHARLNAKVGAYRTAIDAAREAFKSKDPQKLIAAKTRFDTALSTVGRDISATIDAINAKLRK